MAAKTKSVSPNKIPTIYQCDSNGREKHTVVADLDGTLLIDSSSFPYFALIAFDVGGILRLLLLLLCAPFVWVLYHLVSESVGIQMLIFATFSGVRVSAIKSAASAVLPKFYSENLHPETWRVFSSCGRKCVLTANPRIMVEPFLKEYLGVDIVLGTEISSWKGIATGFVAGSGVCVGKKKVAAFLEAFRNVSVPDVGIGDKKSDFPFMKLCKEMYVVPSKPGVKPVKTELLPNPVIFHDGRLVRKPTPLTTLLILLWFPIAIPLSIVRTLVSPIAPISLWYYAMYLLGCPIKVNGTISRKLKRSSAERGVIFVCNHRTLVDCIVVTACLGHKTTIPSYSIANSSNFVSPIKSITLSRDRVKDAMMMDNILKQGKCLVMCPEGTTCREPYLLRFSALFAELSNQIVPVAITVKQGMFHGTTARGHKWLDPFFIAMNPMPIYEITFLNKLSADETIGKSSHDIANSVQEAIGATLNYKCTSLTRKDKYRTLAGTDGIVGQKPIRNSRKRGSAS